jgi:hypothetical protein
MISTFFILLYNVFYLAERVPRLVLLIHVFAGMAWGFGIGIFTLVGLYFKFKIGIGISFGS